MHHAWRIVALLTAITVLLLADSNAWACPGCKQALATAEGEQANMVQGYFWSILFMMAMPFSLFGLFASSMYLSIRRARKAANAAAATSSATSEQSPPLTASQPAEQDLLPTA